MVRKGIFASIRETISEHRIAASIALVLMLVVSIPLGMAFANGNQDNGKTINYVSLGDSFTSGYGLRGSYPAAAYENPTKENLDKVLVGMQVLGFDVDVPNSYPSVINAKLKSMGYTVNFKPYSQSAMRAYDLRLILDEDFSEDGYTREWYTYKGAPWTTYVNSSGKTGIEGLREDYRIALAEADLITYDLGKNDFFNCALNNIFYGVYDHDLSKILSECEYTQYYAARNMIHAMLEKYTGGCLTGDDLKSFENLVDALVFAYVGYRVNYDATLDIIRELNPDAKIMVLSIGNLLAGVDITIGGYVIPLGTIFGSLVDSTNLYIAGESKHADDIIFVDAVNKQGGYTLLAQEAIDYNGDPDTLSQNFIDLCNVYSSTDEFLLKANSKAVIQQYTGGTIVEDAFNKALVEGYDAFARLSQSILTSNASLDVMPASEEIGTATREALAGIYTMSYSVVAQAYFAEVSGVSAEEAIEKLIEDEIAFLKSNPMYMSVSVLYFRAAFGNGYYTHPSPEGHLEDANAVLASFFDEPTTTESYYDMLKTIVNKYKLAYKNYGRPFISKLFDDIADYFKADRSNLSTAFAALAGSSDSEEFIKNLMNYLDAANVKGLQALESMLDEAQAYCEQHPELYHVHSMKYVHAQAATCSHAGHKAYWECRTCGKLYSDMFGLHEIDSCDVEIAATSHSWRHVNAVKLFRLTIIPAYDVCTSCGARK